MSKDRLNKPFPYTTDPAGIPTTKNWDLTRLACYGGPCVDYACPDGCWVEHLEAWRREMRNGNTTAPQPMPYEHCMFDDPVAYGMVPYGCTDEAVKRAAWDRHWRAQLNGWDRDMTPEQVDKIVKASVDASMGGESLGAAPYLACIYTSIL
jgi:hypothetical protein